MCEGRRWDMQAQSAMSQTCLLWDNYKKKQEHNVKLEHASRNVEKTYKGS